MIAGNAQRYMTTEHIKRLFRQEEVMKKTIQKYKLCYLICGSKKRISLFLLVAYRAVEKTVYDENGNELFTYVEPERRF